jgi:glutamate 5-kinase
MAIAQGRQAHPLQRMLYGGRCTWFVSAERPQTARKRWIGGALNPTGAVVVDGGALKALSDGRSLLPAGVAGIEGSFQRGDAVRICAPDGREVARGLTAYGDADARRIMGRKSSEIAEILGYRGREELIHRDDLVLT